MFILLFYPVFRHPIVLCTVTLLRRSGQRLKRSEYPAPVRGTLEIGYWEGAANSFKRPVRKADLWEVMPMTRRPLLTPLFEPVILRTVDDGFLLSGIELATCAGTGIAEHGQVWLCRPLLVDQQGSA